MRVLFKTHLLSAAVFGLTAGMAGAQGIASGDGLEAQIEELRAELEALEQQQAIDDQIAQSAGQISTEPEALIIIEEAPAVVEDAPQVASLDEEIDQGTVGTQTELSTFDFQETADAQPANLNFDLGATGIEAPYETAPVVIQANLVRPDVEIPAIDVIAPETSLAVDFVSQGAPGNDVILVPYAQALVGEPEAVELNEFTDEAVRDSFGIAD